MCWLKRLILHLQALASHMGARQVPALCLSCHMGAGQVPALCLSWESSKGWPRPLGPCIQVGIQKKLLAASLESAQFWLQPFGKWASRWKTFSPSLFICKICLSNKKKILLETKKNSCSWYCGTMAQQVKPSCSTSYLGKQQRWPKYRGPWHPYGKPGWSS